MSLDKLERMAAKQKAKAAAVAAKRDRDANKVSARARKRIAQRTAQREAGGVPAPTSLADTTRFLALILGGLCIVMGVVVFAALVGSVPWRYLVGGAGVWAIAFALCYWDNKAWRRRLPFALEGYDWIHGEDPTADNDERGAWLAVRVAITLRQPSVDGALHRTTILEILVSRINADLAADSDASERQQWTVDPGTGSAGGETKLRVYTQRWIERWLRGEVSTLARAFPIERVTVHVRYTGSSYSLPTPD